METIISPCKQYRYVLTRSNDLLCPVKSSALFIMLNPSTADAYDDDNTIRRLLGFTRLWNCNGFVVGNLYAFRTKNPKELWKAKDPIGPENDKYLRALLEEHGDVICAWGNNAKHDRVQAFLAMAKETGARLFCLGITKAGQPIHPLFVKADQKLISWNTK